jgi:hypothetical protein
MPALSQMADWLQGETQELPHVFTLFFRMLLAAVLGGGLAYRVWRRFMPKIMPPTLQGAHSQTLIAAAGAVMVVVVGGQPSRALGLVAIGSLIRFRSGIGDPRDAALMFVMIGIGMACGLGLTVMACAAAVVVMALLIFFDLSSDRTLRRMLVTFNAEDPMALCAGVARLFPGMRVLEFGKNAVELGKDNGKVVLELALRGDLDAEKLKIFLESNGVPGIRRVALAYDE